MAKRFYYKYTVVDGDRWDTIAHQFYGDASLEPLLIADNGHLPTQTHLNAGDIVFIQQEVQVADLMNTKNLPPWRS